MRGCFRVQARDNVATMLGPGQRKVAIIGETPGHVDVGEGVQAGHKVALVDIRSGEPVIKYGVPIGRATRDIHVGDWVHLHNCASRYDERSQTFDPSSGAATDTPYE